MAFRPAHSTRVGILATMASILGLGGSLTGKAATLKPLTDSSFVRRSRSRNKRPASPFASAYAKANVR